MRPSATQFLWIVDVYGFALAGLLITMGNLGDRIGRKRLLLIGIGRLRRRLRADRLRAELRSGSSRPGRCSASPAPPSCRRRCRSSGTSSPTRGSGPPRSASGAASPRWASRSGPVVGGLLLDHFWWGSVFLINVPVAVADRRRRLVVLPESRNPRPGRLDLVSVPLSSSGSSPSSTPSRPAAHDGVAQADVWVAAAIGLVALAVFTRRQTRLAEPLIDVRLFRHRAFSGAIGANLVCIFSMLARVARLRPVLPARPGLVAAQSRASRACPAVLSAALGGALAAPLVGAIGRARVVGLGLGLCAAGFLLYSQIGHGHELCVLVLADDRRRRGHGIHLRRHQRHHPRVGHPRSARARRPRSRRPPRRWAARWASPYSEAC